MMGGAHSMPAPPGDFGHRAAAVTYVSSRPGGKQSLHLKNDLERTIALQLDKLISDEPTLRNRDITFTVDDSDVIVTGNVQSDAEREKTNEIAMNVPGVRSVANALRVSP
jgi:hypothetical protein